MSSQTMTIPTGSAAPLPTRVAVLGTLAMLVRLVADLHPDLLCLDMTLEQWQRQDFGDLPPEYRDALLPLAYQTDYGGRIHRRGTPPGWRGRLINLCRRGLASIQRAASGRQRSIKAGGII